MSRLINTPLSVASFASVLLIAACSFSQAKEPAESAKANHAEYDQAAVVAEIDLAIAQAVDPQIKEALAKARVCAKFGHTELNLDKMQLTELPPVICQLTKLTNLNLSMNRITVLPPEIGNLTNWRIWALRQSR